MKRASTQPEILAKQKKLKIQTEQHLQSVDHLYHLKSGTEDSSLAFT